MRVHWIGATWCLVGALFPAPVLANKLYRCTTADIITAGDNGKLTTYPNDRYWRELYTMIVDGASGLVRHGGAGAPVQWHIVQEGHSANDLVLIRHRSLADAATDLIRIRDWDSQPQVTFMAFSLSTFVTGTCEVIR